MLPHILKGLAGMNGFLLALGGTGFTFAMTALGATVVFFFGSQKVHDGIQRVFLGFAAGVMIAASIWSLLIPSIEKAEELGLVSWLPASGGLAAGVLFLMAIDKLLPFFHPGLNREEGVKNGLKRTTLLVFSITLHNIPEGMAVGLAFALAAEANSSEMLASAIALAVGIGIQNFPEGAAIALPIRQSGASRKKSFLWGTLSGLAEPVFGTLTVLAVGGAVKFMPWLLSFAAGAMLYVVVEELIPEAHLGSGHHGTFGVMAGFIIMMILDVAI